MPKFRPVTHVIFDMDGLILDTEKLYKSTVAAIVSDYGKIYSPEVRLAVMGTKAFDSAKIIVESLNIPITVEEFATRAKEEQAKVMGDANLMPGAERLIRHLHYSKVPIAIATSSSHENFVLKTAKHAELFRYFHHIVKGSEDPEVKEGKPAPDIFLVASRRFQAMPPPEKCLVFEDSPNGVKAAVRAGMQVVMVPEEYVPDEYKQDATIVLKSLLDFKPEDFGLPPFPN
ncbi:hypothetical protein AAG570_010280 [Ranatra chinensis]|uniref:Pseudouridine-5'-phosphatase n=1 Tax=Ranatra chinensis TaxID=642074 RepID=A0ABD0YM61_9HEMI